MMEAKIEKKLLYEKWWNKYPRLKDVLLKTGLFLKYRTLKVCKLPNKIFLPSSRILYINPTENRGKALLLTNGVTQQRLANFWQKAVNELHPTFVVDIGVNYGECLFSTTYDEMTKVYGIEANHQLLPFLEQSRIEHPNREQIQIVYAFATDQEEGTHSFFVDKNWSGTSSGTRIVEHDMVEEYQVPSITINQLLADQLTSEDTLLFKIDVEGFEAYVLNGMNKVIQKANRVVGFIEFDSGFMKRAGTDMEAFFSRVKEHFYVYAYIQENHIQDISLVTYEELAAWWETDEIHTDLLLSTFPLPDLLKQLRYN
ncbi:FkbM family methyltransferase [Bacillus salitolerans]|uniref:FkbM family methyltransferase n=1 Tax=Bacillus salitolerans TaxID=1437434 RepID=A0ABW4LTA0_9BACI